MKKLIPLLMSVLFVFACNNENENNGKPLQVKVTESKGVWQNPDNFAKPITIPAGIPETVSADNPKINPTNLNVHVAGTPKLIVAGTPKINTPGKDTFLLPKVIPVSKDILAKITKPGGLPEIVVAKDMAGKDQNPANFSFFKVLQGLKHNTIRCMLQDKTGSLWFGTNAGVCRYDGKSFSNFTDKEGLANNVVWSILEDKTGNLWFGTEGGGVSRYDGKSFCNFTEKEGLVNNVVLCILEDQAGNLWFGTNGGVCRYDGKTFTNFTEKEGLTNNTVLSISEDKAGSVWFGTLGGVCRYDGKSFRNYTDKEGLPNNVVRSILKDKAGNLWFGTESGGVSRYDGKSFSNFSDKEGLVNNAVLSILEDQAGNLWFGTLSGLCRYDGKSFSNFTDKEGFTNNSVLSILEDQAGSLWFGTGGGGVCRYNGKSFSSFTDREGLANNVVLSISEDQSGNLWFGTSGGGVCRYDGKSFSNYTVKEEPANNFVLSILEDQAGNLWFGTHGRGVRRYDGKSFSNYTVKEGLANNIVRSILQDKSGNLWFGTDGGVSRYDGKSFSNYTDKEGLANNEVLSLLQDREGNIWFGTNGGGVCRYDGNSFSNFTDKEGLANNTVLSILEDQTGAFWFGTDGGGVSRYDGKFFSNYTDKEGLASNAVLSLLQDKDGNIWFGTRKGLSRISNAGLEKLVKKSDNFNPIKEALFYNYGYSDGFLGLHCRRNSVLQDSKGRIWWGTDVLTCYTPEGDIADTTAPVTQLNNIKLFGEEIAWANLGAVVTDSTGKEIMKGKSKDTTLGNGVIIHDIKFDGITKGYPLPQNLSLPYDNNNLTFNFIGIHLQSHNHIKYQYKLEGLEKNWSVITERTEAPYGNLPSGDYVFKVKAMNQSGVWSEPFEFKFEVRPPWWQTWWFRALVFILIVSLIWFYIKNREKKLVVEKEKLEKTVKERTAEVVEQKHIIEEKHKEITDSINYAERIQRSFLATKEILDENLSEYFVLFKPKDIVSGDFYWADKIVSSSGVENFTLATADSTGHGVPGAIMSLLNITSIESAIKDGYTKPSDILNAARKTIIERLKKDGSAEGGKDGMDCSLLCFDFANMKLQVAVANNPVWIVREVLSEEFLVFNKEEPIKNSALNTKNYILKEIKPDKMPVGKHDKENEPFTLHEIDLQKGDLVYTLTDGYPDQFGGEKGKKYMIKNLRELIIKNAYLPLSEQKQILENEFKNWAGNLEQVDDVTIVGIKI